MHAELFGDLAEELAATSSDASVPPEAPPVSPQLQNYELPPAPQSYIADQGSSQPAPRPQQPLVTQQEWALLAQQADAIAQEDASNKAPIAAVNASYQDYDPGAVEPKAEKGKRIRVNKQLEVKALEEMVEKVQQQFEQLNKENEVSAHVRVPMHGNPALHAGVDDACM